MATITVLQRDARLSDGPSLPRSRDIDPDGPEAWILAVAAHRDRAAFARLHARFAPRLTAVFGRDGHGQAEELAQETLLAVWRKAEYFDPTRANAATWIFTIARNLRIDALRRSGRVRFVDVDDFDEIDDRPNGEAVLLDEERDERVRAAVAALPPDQADVVRLTYFTEKTQIEIARDLGIPLGTVKSRLRLAAQRLRALLEIDR
jgi:RNA polymerase sigma-70 factor (ECF subfamily)